MVKYTYMYYCPILNKVIEFFSFNELDVKQQVNIAKLLSELEQKIELYSILNDQCV